MVSGRETNSVAGPNANPTDRPAGQTEPAPDPVEKAEAPDGPQPEVAINWSAGQPNPLDQLDRLGVDSARFDDQWSEEVRGYLVWIRRELEGRLADTREQISGLSDESLADLVHATAVPLRRARKKVSYRKRKLRIADELLDQVEAQAVASADEQTESGRLLALYRDKPWRRDKFEEVRLDFLARDTAVWRARQEVDRKRLKYEAADNERRLAERRVGERGQTPFVGIIDGYLEQIGPRVETGLAELDAIRDQLEGLKATLPKSLATESGPQSRLIRANPVARHLKKALEQSGLSELNDWLKEVKRESGFVWRAVQRADLPAEMRQAKEEHKALTEEWDRLHRARDEIMAEQHPEVGEARERADQSLNDWRRAESMLEKAKRKVAAKEFAHPEVVELKEYLGLIELDAKESQRRIESLLQEAAGDTGRLSDEVAGNLDEARRVAEWYVSEKQVTTDSLDNVRHEISRQAGVDSCTGAWLELRDQYVRDFEQSQDLEAAAKQNNPALADLEVQIDRISQEEEAVRERVGRYELVQEKSSLLRQANSNLAPGEMTGDADGSHPVATATTGANSTSARAA